MVWHYFVKFNNIRTVVPTVYLCTHQTYQVLAKNNKWKLKMQKYDFYISYTCKT